MKYHHRGVLMVLMLLCTHTLHNPPGHAYTFVSADLLLLRSPSNAKFPSGTIISSSPFPFPAAPFNITGLLVRPPDPTGCDVVPPAYSTIQYMNASYGYIMLLQLDWCSIEQKIRVAQRAGALGVVCSATGTAVGLATNMHDGSDSSSFVIHYIEVSDTDVDALVQQATPWSSLSADTIPTSQASVVSIVTITDSDNLFLKAFDSDLFLIGYQIVLPIFSFLIVALAFASLYRFYRLRKTTGRPVPKIAFICLAIEAFANTIRGFYFSIDPLYSRRIIPFFLARPLSTITVPMGFITSVLIALVRSLLLGVSISYAHHTISESYYYACNIVLGRGH